MCECEWCVFLVVCWALMIYFEWLDGQKYPKKCEHFTLTPTFTTDQIPFRFYSLSNSAHTHTPTERVLWLIWGCSFFHLVNSYNFEYLYALLCWFIFLLAFVGYAKFNWQQTSNLKWCCSLYIYMLENVIFLNALW